MAAANAPRSDGEVVGYFTESAALEAAIDDLLSSGFDRAEISLLASEKAIEDKYGHKYRKVEDVEDDETVPRTHFVSAGALGDAEGTLIGAPLYVAALASAGVIVASGGTALAALAGAAVGGGAGALLGSGFAKRLGKRHAEHLEHQLEHGGLLLWVHVDDAGRERCAVDILRNHSGQDVHVHALQD